MKPRRSSRLNRREVLAGVGAASLLPPSTAVAAPAHAFKVGDFEITVLSDGHLTIPTRFLARNATEADIKTSLGITADLVTPPCNITLIRTPTETILIDVGAGPHFMPGAGKLADNMDAAGIDRKSITKIVLTHAHPDHLWGMLDDFDDAPMFPNASYVISAAEWNFWTADDAASRLPHDRQSFAPGAKRNLERINGKLSTIQPGTDIASGIRAIDTSGHTAGHISIEIGAGNDAVLVLADALTHAIVSFAHPEWSPVADHHDPDRAVATRKMLLSRLAADGSRVVGFHLPFPGIGNVEQNGLAYRFVPST
jgi:glyoxylase-like metal-dependent hydrolase (beta-lactamase superfamily II)